MIYKSWYLKNFWREGTKHGSQTKAIKVNKKKIIMKSNIVVQNTKTTENLCHFKFIFVASFQPQNISSFQSSR